MNTTFGDVAELYDAVRPEHPREIAGLVLSYAGTPSTAAEIGAGTGKGTALFAGRGFPITCIEPDPRMAIRLRDRLPDADLTFVQSAFEDWEPPSSGVDLLYACLAWHWVDPATRASRAVAALAPGGTLALIGRKTVILDEDLNTAIREVFDRYPASMPERPPLPAYAVPELLDQPDLADVRTWTLSQSTDYDTDRYLTLQETMAPFRLRSDDVRAATTDGLRTAIDSSGGIVPTRLDTYVVLARRH